MRIVLDKYDWDEIIDLILDDPMGGKVTYSDFDIEIEYECDIESHYEDDTDCNCVDSAECTITDVTGSVMIDYSNKDVKEAERYITKQLYISR